MVDVNVAARRQSSVMRTARKKPVRGAASIGDSLRNTRTSRFASRLLAEWKQLGLTTGEARVVVAVSGGADSVALLLALDELVKTGRLSFSTVVAHLDHGLRAASREDARWVSELTRSLGYQMELGRARVAERARLAGDNLEQAARVARYEFLARVAARVGACAVVTAHTMDDQAETVLLRLMRGSGAEGLGGIEPVRTLEAGGEVRLARPLLNWAGRAETEGYCRAREVEWRSDEMNSDEKYARVRVRNLLIPLMQSFNARAIETLSRTARLLREDSAALDGAAALLLEEARVPQEAGADGDEAAGISEVSGISKTTYVSELLVEVLVRAPAALRRRALRRWIAEGRGSLRRLEMVHLLGVERLLSGERGGRVAELPGGATVSRKKGRLVFRLKKVEKGDGDP